MADVTFKNIAQNKKAYHEFFIEEKFEVGIELVGTEVKSIRAGGVNLKDSFCGFKDGEIFVINMHISPYEKRNIFNKDSKRTRKLLMHKQQISTLFALTKQDGYAIVPLSIYFKGSLVKLSIGLAKGKKIHDKRDSIAQKDAKRQIDRAIKERNR